MVCKENSAEEKEFFIVTRKIDFPSANQSRPTETLALLRRS
jgi:hypothetical protein